MAETESLTLPGFVNAHSHAFQRALRGRVEGGDFWAWRDAMLDLADKQTPEAVRTDYARTYAEMRATGYTAVGEFHYLGLAEARAAAAAAREAGIELVLLLAAYARVCGCTTTEANLGDGVAPVEQLCDRGIGICIGSDSNVRIDPLEELRELEGIARRQALRRNVLSAERLLCYGADEGAGALGLERWDDVRVDLGHVSLRGLEDGDVFAALVFGCSSDVFA